MLNWMDLECDDVFQMLHIIENFSDKCHVSFKIKEKAFINNFVPFVV